MLETLHPAFLPIAMAATAALVLATYLVATLFPSRLARALALLLFLNGLLEALLVFGVNQNSFHGALRGYLFIAMPFAILHFGTCFLDDIAGRRRPWGIIWGATAMCLIFIYAWDHETMYTHAGNVRPLGYLVAGQPMAWALLAWLIGRHALRDPARRTSLRLLTLGLALQPLYMLAFRALVFLPTWGHPTLGPELASSYWARAELLVALSPAVPFILLANSWRDSPFPESWQFTRRATLLASGAVASAMVSMVYFVELLTPLALPGTFVAFHFWASSIWMLTSIVIIMRAVLIHGALGDATALAQQPHRRKHGRPQSP